MARKHRKSMRNKVQKDAKKSASGGSQIQLPSGVGFFTAEPGGRCKIDILPYTVSDSKHPDEIEVGDIWYKRPFRQHRNVGVNKDTEICPRSVGKPCPICEHRESILSSKDPDQDVVNALKAQYRILYNVRPLSGPDKGKILVWDFSYHNFQKQLDAEINDPENEKYASFADLEDGYSLKIRFSEESFNRNKFAKTERIDFDARDDLDESILEKTVNLDKALNVKSYKDLQKKFFDLEEDDESQNNEEPVEKEEEQEENPSAKEEDVNQSKLSLLSKAEIKKMNRKELKKVIKNNELEEIDSDDYDEIDELREAIIIELHGDKTAESESKKEASSKSKTKKSKEEKKADLVEGKCPHGHKWGEADMHEECDDCDLWDNCIAVS